MFDLFADSDFYSKLRRLALPIAFQTLMLAMVAACDAFMLGRLDQAAMAAVSLATQVQFVQNMLVSCIVSTVVILGAQYWGKGDTESIGRVFRISLRTVVFVSIIFAASCIFLPRELMMLFAKSGSPLIGLGAEYLRIAGASYLVTGVSQCYLSSMKVTDHVNRATAISIGAVVANIILNAVFIFGLCGAPQMGVRGAALATLLARTMEFAASVISSRQKGYLRPEWHRILESYPELARDFRKCALPLLGGAFFWGIGFTSYTAAMGHIGDDAAAANAVAAVIRDLLCCLCDGIAYGGGIVVGNELGAGKLALGKLYGDRLAKISVISGLTAMSLVLLATYPVTHFVPLDLTDAARKLLGEMMFVLSIYMIGRCVNTIVINGVFAAGGDTLFDFYSLAVCMWCLAVPLAFLGVFVFHWHPVLVYACTCVDEVGKLPWVYAHFKRYIWVKDLTR